MKFFEKAPQFSKMEMLNKRFLTYLSAFVLSITSMQVSAKGIDSYKGEEMSKKEKREAKHNIVEIKEIYAKYEDYVKSSQSDTFSLMIGTDKRILMYHANDGYAITLEEKGDKGKDSWDYTDGNFVSINKNSTGHGYAIPGDGIYSFTLYDADRDGVVNTVTGKKSNDDNEAYSFNPLADVKEQLGENYPFIMKTLENSIDLKNKLSEKAK